MIRYLSPLLLILIFIVVLPARQADAGVVPMAKVRVRAKSDSWKECYKEQTALRIKYGNALPRCEGIRPPTCYRFSLVRPNHLRCGLSFFLSYGIIHRECWRTLHYYAPNGGVIHIVYDKYTDYKRSCQWGFIG